MSANIYLKKNDDWEEKIKYGYVKGNETNLINRLNDSREEHSELSNFQSIITFKVEDTYKLPYKEIDKIISLIVSDPTKILKTERLYNIKLPLCRELCEYLVKSTTKSSNEFIQKDGISCLLRVLREEFHLLGLTIIKEYTPEELDAINSASREQVYKKTADTHESFWDKLDEPNEDQYNWNERPYQRIIIDYILNIFLTLSRIYLELATGGGKSYIIYKILAAVKPKTIVIFSPRKTINKQNSSEKYLSLLDNDYLVFNCSIDKDFDKFKKECERLNKNIMILACSQGSNKKVYKIIHKYNLSDIFIWYDEAHNTVENWITNPEEETETTFLLNNTNIITKRIFTSASPNKKRVEQNPLIFGELYSPIKVKDLIKLKWLCPIKCKILEYDISNFNILNWILDGFNENTKSFGFSFHSRDNNAYNLFYEHYKLYLQKETNIKPYLLIHEGGLNSTNKNNLKDISLELDYKFRDITDFENKKEMFDITPRNLAYVVKQYDMGYDFQELDYIIISDAKVSHQEITQCIGRGTRSDKKGDNGQNLNKELMLMLPTYIKDEDNNKYKNIIEVLRYLILDLDMDIEKLLIKPIDSKESKETIGIDYKGDNSNSSKLLDLLYTNNILNRVNTKTLIKFCKKYSIKTEQDYYKIKRINPSLNLKNNLYEYPGFYWKNVVDPNNEVYYSSKLECINSRKKLINSYELTLNEEEYDEFLEDIEDNGWIELNKYDAKIPPYRDLDKYYP